MKEPELEEEALRARARGNEVTIERQSLKDEIPPASLTGPDGAGGPQRSSGRTRPFPRHRECRATTGSIAPATASMSRWSMSAPITRSNFRKSSRRRNICARWPQRPAAPPAPGDPPALRLVGLRELPIYAGAGYVGVKRTGRAR